MNKILTLILVLLCSLANSQNSFKISGKLKGFKENALVKIDRENIALDSCYLKDGNFKLKGSLKQSPSLVYLTIKNGEEWVYSSFFIGNENITINAEIKNFPYNVRAEGSKYDDLRYEFITLGKKLNFQRNEYLKEIVKLREQNKWNDSLQSAYWGDTEPLGKITKIDQELDKIQREFITKNLNSYYALHLLEESKTQYSKVELSSLVKKIKPSFRNTIYVKSISTYIKNPDLKIGDKFYDFSAINSKNKKVKFSDFF